MLISATMDLAQLAQRMGPGASIADAKAMRDVLVTRYIGQDTAELGETEWVDALAAARRTPAGRPPR